MYSSNRYWSDLMKAWKPVKKSVAVFGKSLRKLDPFTSFGLCLLMVARFMWFFIQLAFFTGRRLFNR